MAILLDEPLQLGANIAAKPVVDRRPIYVTVGCLFVGSVGVLMTKGNGEISQPMRASIDSSSTILAAARCTWTDMVTGSVSGHNLANLNGKTLETCKEACNQNPACKSIDFRPNKGYCSLGDCQANECGNDGATNFVYSSCLPQ